MNQQDRRATATTVGGGCDTSNMSSDQQAPTPEQIAAVEWLQTVSARGKLIVSDSSLDVYADAILAALPDEWTKWQPTLPTKPGHYSDRDDFVWTLSADGEWSGAADHVEQYLPLTRLVPERPQVTRDQIRERVVREWHSARGTENMTEQIDYLVNGDPR